MSTTPKPPKKQDPPKREEIEAEVPGAKSSDEENRKRYERERKGLESDEETC